MSGIECNLVCTNRAMTEGVNLGHVKAGTREVCRFGIGAACGLTVIAETGLKQLIDYDEPVPATFVRMYDENNERVRTCPWADLYAGRPTRE